MNRTAALVAVLLVVSSSEAQVKTKPAPNGGKITPEERKLSAIVARLAGGTEPQTRKSFGGWIMEKMLGSEAKTDIKPSDFADKPFRATLYFRSKTQSTKIYKTEDEAKKGEWLPVDKIAGSPNGSHGIVTYSAVFYFANGEWTLDSLTFGSRAGNVVGGVGRVGKDNPWWKLLSE